MLLAGCAASVEPPPPPPSELPEIPEEIRACLHMEGVEIPERGLDAGEVEKFWKSDRRILAALGRCGQRFILWYEQLRMNWR
ncbi:hypothetical protein Xaut_4507 [Xanthobacter versatilis]|uniref:Uncharacterized protein n=1 Tax=Xanthobacter autotrophicus (strain ATCC BAA-1158 / Py2) TaxID=78245 RepID=A7INY2_XANP2|nr:hypothetical protein Xaut_4507 [Xanthobacter autotrophicus Py2]